MNYNLFILFIPCLFSLCLCEITEEKKAKLLSDFINYYNFRPNVNHKASDGFLRSISEIDASTYQIEVSFRAKHNDVFKMMKCSADIQDLDDKGIAIVNNNMDCEELQQQVGGDAVASIETVEGQTERKPVSIENEEQTGTRITSGEQLIAIHRDEPSAPCVGCASHVNIHAKGVPELASLGVRHLDIHEPSVKHTLDSVIDVERQVQIVNGVRYILTLSINVNNCTEAINDLCTFIKTCRITILVKPWQILPSGAKYRSILSNNCTEQWQFGDSGEILPEPPDSHDNTKKEGSISADDEIKIERHQDVQSLPSEEKTLTENEIKALEEQILPFDHVPESSSLKSDTLSPSIEESNKDHIIKTTPNQRFSGNSLPETESIKPKKSSLSQDKKIAIDEMLDFLNFSGYESAVHSKAEDSAQRSKRSYDYDLQVLSLTQDYRDLKQSIENAKYVFEMAQAMVDYLNVMDIDVKNRAVKNVIKAEEEEDDEKHFVYIQAQVAIPCDKPNCEPKESQTKICNGVLESTNRRRPQVLYSFCYTDTKEIEVLNKVKDVESDDPVLLRLSKEALKKIEFESKEPHAMKIKKIASANTRLASGRLTKISMIVDYINCGKSVPLVLRKNCSSLEYLGSRICEVLVHERQWLKERTITYTCTERPMDMIINRDKQHKNVTIDDPKIAEIMQDALQYLEIQSSKKNKQKIIKISNISTQIVAGFLIKIDFVVGYTNCTNTLLKSSSNKCELLRNERLRECKVQVWDRSWIVEGRQMEVMCDEDVKVGDILYKTKKKRAVSFGDMKYQDTNDPINNTLSEKPIKKENLQDISKRRVLGGKTVHNPNDPSFMLLAQESLQKYIVNSGIQQPHSVVSIVKVTTQVVAGSVTRINFLAAPTYNPDDHVLVCFSKIWEQTWLGKKEIDVSCVNDNHWSKRQMPGGETEQNTNDPTFMLLAQESLQKYIINSGIQQPHSVVSIVNVTRQVVASSVTRINFLAAPANNPDDHVLVCFSKISEQNWLGKKEIDVSCVNDNHWSKRQMPGGETEQNTNDPTFMLLAQESLQKYIINSGIQQPHSVVSIVNVTRQVVAGSVTRINFLAAPANNPDDHVLVCFSKISEQTWLGKTKIDVSCVNDSHRSKRQILGGETEQNSNDPTFMILAQESLQKYIINSGIQQPHSVLSIVNVTRQVVAGPVTRINFLAAPSHNPDDHVLVCFSKIWEQTWLGKKEIDVSCVNDNHRSKRQMPGGETEQNPNDPTFMLLAQESLQKYIINSGIQQPHSVVSIVNVTRQVVAGSVTRINFLAAPHNPDDHVLVCFSKIWEQTWLGKKEINVSCVNNSHRSKRQILGGETEQNPNNPTFMILAQESLQKYVINSEIQQPHSVVSIVNVTRQVVAGSVTRINFLAAPSHNPDDHVLVCFSKIWEQTWLGKKEIDVSCVNDNHRSKRQMPGGETEQNPNDPTFMLLAQESLQKYIINSGIQQPHSVVSIVNVTRQVVAGSVTRINFLAAPHNPDDHVLVCFSKIWEQTWLGKKEINVSCVNNSHRSKRQILGGETEQNPNNPTFMILAQESLQKYVINSEIQQPHSVVSIVNVTRQVVAGSVTRINFLAAPSHNPDDHVLVCFSKIWEQTWLGKKEIDVSCVNDNHRSKRQMPGGETEQNPNDPTFMLLAQESLQKYIINSGIQQPHSVVSIVNVTRQVVAGSVTRINFLAAPSHNPNDHVLVCFSKIWEQTWLGKKEIDVSCVNDNHRSKRQMPGGETEQNPKDPTFMLLAQESLQKYIINSGVQQPHSVVSIVNVTRQVVAGSVTRINFLAALSHNPDDHVLVCFSKIWEQTWLGKKEIDVSCVNDNHRSKRQMPGGETEQNPNNPTFMLLAQESLQKYIINSGIQQPHSVISIVNVTRQVVAGSVIRINFLAAPSHNPDDHVLVCFSKIWEQTWLGKKEIDVSCVNDNHRSKRQMPGGETEQNPNDPTFMILAQESLQKYIINSGIQQPHSVVSIVNVTRQVVAGSVTRVNFLAAPSHNSDDHVLVCFSKIWEQTWLGKKEIDVSCVNDNHRSKRQMSGGETEQNPNDPTFMLLAQESLQKYIINSGIQQPHSVVSIVNVTRQVVAGSVTRINFLAAPHNPDDHVLVCFSKIWEQTWLGKKEINVSCVNDSHRSKRQILGGETEQNPNDPTFMILAQESLQKYIINSGIQQPHSVVSIVNVTRQVVAGSVTRINFLAAPHNPDDYVLVCFSKIWEQTWLGKKEINVSCVNDSHRSKRQILGGETEQNPNNPTFMILAQESLQKYIIDSGVQQPHSVVSIVNVTRQVVAGSVTRINFLAAPSHNPDDHVLVCFSKIWEQTWLGKKEIDVSCVNDNHRSKRQMPGGETEQNPNDPTFMILAQESLQKYIINSGIQQPHSVVSIVNVTRQVVAGSMTRINFLAAPTNNPDDHGLVCFSKILEQTWLNKKDIDVSCNTDQRRFKRKVICDDFLEQDSSNSTYLQLAKEVLQKYLMDNVSIEPHKVLKVEKVTTQNCSGKLTRLDFIVLSTNVSKSDITKCYSEVWEKSLTESKDISVSCQPVYKNTEDPKNALYQEWARESLQKYLTESNKKQSYKVVQIEEVTSHGFATNIIFVANSTEGLDDFLNCFSVILNDINEMKIDVVCETVNLKLKKRWDHVDENNYHKYPYTKYHKIEKELVVTKPEFQLLASQSLREYSKKVGVLHKLVAVNKITKSIMSDVVYKIYFSAFPTECFSNVTKVRALTCNVITNSLLNCRADILGEQRLPTSKMHVECVMPEDYLDLFDSIEENTDARPSKIGIPQNIQDLKAREFAEDALQKYLSLTDTKFVYRVTGIYSFYEFFADERIEFSISPTTCLSFKFTSTDSSNSCPFKQPRLIYYCNAKSNTRIDSKKDIKVTCKTVQTAKNRSKRQINTELIDDAENEVDEDTMYYYAKAAVSKINENPKNNNMFKLVTIHAVKSTVQMKAVVVKMYLEVAETYCVRFQSDVTIENCEEMEGLNHKLCLARIFPAPGDDLVIRHVNVVCDDDEISFNVLTGLHVFELLRLSLQELERKPEFHFKLVHQGEPQLIPTLESKKPLKLNFVIATTNCSKTVDLDKNPYQCYIDTTIPSRSCSSFIWLETATRIIKYIDVDCNSEIPRQKRSSLNVTNLTDSAEIKDLVVAALEKLEMASLHRYKQRVLHINSYSSKITTGKVTTIDFDVAYTSCLKYEWVQNITSCDIIDHLPRRHCVAQVWERLWIRNGRHINVTCEDDETPLEAHIEFESAEMAMQLAQEALKHIEAKYPHPQKQKVVRIFSLEKQIVAGIHYKMKIEVGFTHCLALSTQTNCTLDNERHMNRFCRVNVWVRPWTDHPPNFRVSCDFQESVTSDLYHGVQAENLFYNFVATYNPSYSNDHVEFERRFEIFSANIKKIHELNVHEKGTATYGVTRFTDLTYQEFKARYMGLNTSLRNSQNSHVVMREADIPNVNLPLNFDWREFDSVTEVKDQGSCGSGWAFSVIGNIEGQWKMQSGELVQLSEQQLLDCDTIDSGCGGGLPELAYRSIEEMGGLETETNYPYESESGKCLFNRTMAKVKIQGAVNITSNETAMAQWLVQNGPISIGINAMAMQFYLGGISHPWKTYCNASDIDHAALIVGFGVKEYPAYHKKIPYWIVKNSWGKSWGEEGYYRVYRGDGTCGVDRMATSAFIPSM